MDVGTIYLFWVLGALRRFFEVFLLFGVAPLLLIAFIRYDETRHLRFFRLVLIVGAISIVGVILMPNSETLSQIQSEYIKQKEASK